MSASLPFPADTETENGSSQLINIKIHNLSPNSRVENNATADIDDHYNDCGINNILSHLMDQGLQIHDVQRLEPGLEEIFFNLIGSSQNNNDNNYAGLTLTEKRMGKRKKKGVSEMMAFQLYKGEISGAFIRGVEVHGLLQHR